MISGGIEANSLPWTGFNIKNNISLGTAMCLFFTEVWNRRPPNNKSYPANIYLSKVNNRNTKKGVKYVQS